MDRIYSLTHYFSENSILYPNIIIWSLISFDFSDSDSDSDDDDNEQQKDRLDSGIASAAGSVHFGMWLVILRTGNTFAQTVVPQGTFLHRIKVSVALLTSSNEWRV